MLNQQCDVSPVFFLHILPCDFIHNVDLHHGVWDEQVALEPIRSVDVHSQNKAVIKRGFLWCFCLTFALFFDYCDRKREMKKSRLSSVINSVNTDSSGSSHQLTIFLLLLFLFSLGLCFIFLISILVSIFILIPLDQKLRLTLTSVWPLITEYKEK